MTDRMISRWLAVFFVAVLIIVGSYDITQHGWSYQAIAPWVLVLIIFVAAWGFMDVNERWDAPR